MPNSPRILMTRKTISTVVTRADHALIQRAAARRRISVSELLGEWIAPALERLRANPNGEADADADG